MLKNGVKRPIFDKTWLTSTIIDAEVMPPGYEIYRNDRKDGYGGVLVATKKKLGAVDISTHFDPCLCELKVKVTV